MPTETEAPPDTWSASLYNQTAAFVYSKSFTAEILALLDAQPGENVLDMGCGSGEVTAHIQSLVGSGGLAVGVDGSDSMVRQCKANGLQHALLGDAQSFEVPADLAAGLNGGFDAYFSNATLHWCKRHPQGVIQSAKRALRPGGRFVVEMGGFMNCIGVRSALHTLLRQRGYDPAALDPWFFPSPDSYKAMLEGEGFDVQHISLTPRATPLAGTLADWLRLFCRPYFLKDMDDERAEEIMSAVQDICRVDCMDAQGKWTMILAVYLKPGCAREAFM